MFLKEWKYPFKLQDRGESITLYPRGMKNRELCTILSADFRKINDHVLTNHLLLTVIRLTSVAYFGCIPKIYKLFWYFEWFCDPKRHFKCPRNSQPLPLILPKVAKWSALWQWSLTLTVNVTVPGRKKKNAVQPLVERSCHAILHLWLTSCMFPLISESQCVWRRCFKNTAL